MAGAPDVVDGFHHFIYGFADPSPRPDLWLRDDPATPGRSGGQAGSGTLRILPGRASHGNRVRD
jgi:hypothetical protein